MFRRHPCPNRLRRNRHRVPRSGEEWSSAGRRERCRSGRACHSPAPTNRHGNREGKLVRAAVSQSRGSNGEVYNMHAMTAAHRTLPLGTIVRVTNLQTGHTALVGLPTRSVHPGRVLDLSLAAAHKVDVYLPGVAEVRVEVMKPQRRSRRREWAVQIGSLA